jgi:RNA polymerase sigma-70 factor (ECF subfamily)
MSRIDQIVRRAQEGDREAVAILYETYREMIYRYIAYRLSSSKDVEDLTAEVFVKMVEGLPNYRITNVPFEVWLYRIAAARLTDFRRRNNRRPQTGLSDDLVDLSPLPEDLTQEQQELENLRRAVQLLNEEQQNILILRFVERKSHEEVAAILGKTIAAVKSAQYRALIRLLSLFNATEKIRHYLGEKDD